MIALVTHAAAAVLWLIVGCTNILGLHLLTTAPFSLVPECLVISTPLPSSSYTEAILSPSMPVVGTPPIHMRCTNRSAIVPGLVWVVHDYCEFCGRISEGIFVNNKILNGLFSTSSPYGRRWSSFPPLRLSRQMLNSPYRIRFDISGWALSGCMPFSRVDVHQPHKMNAGKLLFFWVSTTIEFSGWKQNINCPFVPVFLGRFDTME